jgi:hypothetical protein
LFPVALLEIKIMDKSTKSNKASDDLGSKASNLKGSVAETASAAKDYVAKKGDEVQAKAKADKASSDLSSKASDLKSSTAETASAAKDYVAEKGKAVKEEIGAKVQDARDKAAEKVAGK